MNEFQKKLSEYFSKPQDFRNPTIFSLAEVTGQKIAYDDMVHPVYVQTENERYTISATLNRDMKTIFYVKAHRTPFGRSFATFSASVKALEKYDARFMNVQDLITKSYFA